MLLCQQLPGISINKLYAGFYCQKYAMVCGGNEFKTKKKKKNCLLLVVASSLLHKSVGVQWFGMASRWRNKNFLI